ncbi:Zinc carboxypeptidase [Amycolatopsis arida]|uniref:Zinc carboxypeptidase n=1 Tax=Amycolatopsis arida TaxID=587909 RepID=A0A1I5TWP3_9PSEU|nr:M14 family metallopeptidase [Amycolatopsis arida]TDX95961.1 zinc carboxypeptidase [Amycolatopsis arida]SFP86736.1 Zinc carboxypeptidase [Amycolatopsis arida]
MFTKRRVLGAVAAAAGVLLLATMASPAGAQTPDRGTPTRGVYTVPAGDAAARTVVAGSGVDVLGLREGALTIVATPEQARSLRARGFTLDQVGDFDAMLAERSGGAGTSAVTADFPPGDEAYHTYAEMTQVLRRAAQSYPNLARTSSVGRSYEGRELPIIKISDNVAQDEAEPEVLFTCNQHAREHLTTEMCIRIVNRFTQGYATDPAIKQLVDTREIWVIPQVNPDGSEYDIAGGRYKGWRKNRQGYGTDPNRNWGYKWGCCGGSSGSPTSDTYRGTAPFSAPETRAVSNFVNSRVVGGTQQIKAHIDFHTYSELVLWPYGYTYADTAPGLDQTQARRFQDVGRQMAATNNYRPQQSSDLYITDGSVNDWMWAQHKILSYTFEMYPRSASGIGGFYPPASVIPRETARNDRAVDILLRAAG